MPSRFSVFETSLTILALGHDKEVTMSQRYKSRTLRFSVPLQFQARATSTVQSKRQQLGLHRQMAWDWFV